MKKLFVLVLGFIAVCPAFGDDVCHTKFGDILVGEHVMQNGVMKILSKVDCSGYALTSDLGIEFEGVCRDGANFVCKAYKCIEGYEPDSGGACVPSTNIVSGAECTATGGSWNGSTCIESNDSVIGGIVKNIDDIKARFGTSKWKNADGKFNTARLASDSIAGVVLGTVGGVVTSTIMKKSQVRNGLEYIKCVVGGQTVASYDDQFSVGLK